MAGMTVNMDHNTIGQVIVGTGAVDATDDEKSRPYTKTETDGVGCYKDPYLYYTDKTEKPKVLVIANYKFEVSVELKGHKKDLKNLEDMWKSEFKTHFFGKTNLTAKDILTECEDFSELLNGKERYCAVFILSHGIFGDRILGTDEEDVSFDDILSNFDNKNIKLHGIPKLFFFQCCRGDVIDKGVPASVAALSGIHQAETLPEVSDTLIMFATQRDKVSFVDSDGSWVVKELMNVFREYHQKEDVTSMLTIVNKRISKKEVQLAQKDPGIVGAKCMSEYRSTLTAKLMLSL